MRLLWPRISTYLSIIVLGVVLLLIAVRKVGRFHPGIWQIMLGGAAAVLLTGQISPADALAAIDSGVMLFLFGMFIVGEAMVQSGALAPLSRRLFCRALSIDTLVMLLIIAAGLLSAVLMNDTVAIIGTPFVLCIARKYDISPEMLLLALAFSLTTGSAMSPIGNPQNLLIALSGGIGDPFLAFFAHLAAPSLICLALIYPAMKIAYPGEFAKCILPREPDVTADTTLAGITRISFAILCTMIGARILCGLLQTGVEIPLTAIAIAAAAPVLLFSQRRVEILRGIDWRTLVFFAALFVLMQSVGDSGFFQQIAGVQFEAAMPVSSLLLLSVIGSQLISNVPFVALFLPVLVDIGAPAEAYMALAAGSTIAGNLLIIGAASNVIIIQNAEKHGTILGFRAFARIGIPVTAIQILVYWLFLHLP
jgi:Na+/H+ antiporter NhaD/arsenite permease-like protein